MRICAYHGNLYQHHAVCDFAEIKNKGFDTVLLCMTEQDFVHSPGAMRALRVTAEATGLYVWVGPWGLAGIFGGEGVTSVRYEDDPVKALRLYGQWAEAAAEAGFQTVFLDEPRPFSLFPHLTEIAASYGMGVTTSLTTDTFDSLTDHEVRDLNVYSLGLSNYFPANMAFEEVRSLIYKRVGRLVRLRPADHHVWIQGFGLGEGDIGYLTPAIIATWTLDTDAKHLGFWSFRACEATSSIAHSKAEHIWYRVHEWIRE